MATSNRPLSPHLQIYKPQITSITSIMHRITGILLTIGTLLLVCWLVAAADSPESYEAFQGFLGSIFGRLLLFGWTLALFYHLCNGIRHMFWDIGVGFTISSAVRSGTVTLIATVVLTLLTWIAGYAMA